MSDDWAASDLIGVLIAGTVNGYVLLRMFESYSDSFLGLALGGIVAYAGAKIIVRLVERVFSSTSNTGGLKDLIAIKNWPHFIIWGAFNGIAFYVLYPMTGMGTMAGVLLGTATFFASNILGYLLKF